MNCKQSESVIEKAERLKATSRVIIIVIVALSA